MSAHRIYHRRKYEPGNYGKFNRNKIKKYEHNNQANVFTLDIYVVSLKNQAVFTFCGGIIILSMSNVCIS